MSHNPGQVLMELAEEASMLSICSSKPASYCKPGEFIMKQPPEVREVLKELKSDDLQKVRWPLWR